MNGKAKRIGANAVVDLEVKYETLNGSMFLICASGTAVRVRSKADATSSEATRKKNPVDKSD